MTYMRDYPTNYRPAIPAGFNMTSQHTACAICALPFSGTPNQMVCRTCQDTRGAEYEAWRVERRTVGLKRPAGRRAMRRG